MQEPIGHINQPLQASPTAVEKPPPLWRELADGSAGPVVRGVVSLALAPLLVGAALLGSFILAAWVPGFAYHSNTRFSPTDELVGCMIALAALVYLMALIWIWTRSRFRLNGFVKAGLLTIVATAAGMLLCWIIVESSIFRASEELLVGGVVCIGIAVVILIWLQAGRQFVRRRPMHNPTDGVIDLRCPSCGYRMVGLYESRCPECGTAYTIDELLARQEFEVPHAPRSAGR
jgi:hypothetical protein